jgi:predicted AAA+ superfamily ATPase
VRQYLRYLEDALLIREFRRYPLARKSSRRSPAKITVTDLGVRNAVFRGAPSLWESDPSLLGPLVETLAQTVIRGQNLAVHFYRGHENPRDRRSPVREIDFVAERTDGAVLPIEVKFRRRIDPDDRVGLNHFIGRFNAPCGIMVTRDVSQWDEDGTCLFVPLLNFLLAF